MQLRESRIILTGGAGGIGQAVAERLRTAGARLCTVDRQSGVDIVADLSDAFALDALCARLKTEETDILINLAGLMYFGHFHDQPASHLAAMMRVNLEAPLRLAQAVIPGMRARGRGQIVNIGSVFGAIPFPHFAAYSATKAGLRAFSEALRREQAGRGISITHIAPRAVKTGLNDGLIGELHKRTKVHNDSPAAVAEIIACAIAGEIKELTIGLPEAFFSKLNALLPGLVDKALLEKRDIADDLLKTKIENPEENPHVKAA